MSDCLPKQFLSDFLQFFDKMYEKNFIIKPQVYQLLPEELKKWFNEKKAKEDNKYRREKFEKKNLVREQNGLPKLSY